MWIFRYLHKLLQYSYIPQSDTTTEWHRQPGMLMFVYLLYYCYHHRQSNLYLSALHYVYAPTSHFDWQTDFCMSEITGVKMMPPSSSVCRLPAMFSYNPMGSLGIAWTVCNPRWLISTPLQWHHKHTLKILGHYCSSLTLWASPCLPSSSWWPQLSHALAITSCQLPTINHRSDFDV